MHSAHVVYAGGCGGWKSCVAAAVLGSFPFCALLALYPHLVQLLCNHCNHDLEAVLITEGGSLFACLHATFESM